MLRLGRLESRVMDALWRAGEASVREIQESFPSRGRPAYTTVQTVLYRLEAKEAVRRTRKIGNAHLFEAVLTREAVQRPLLDELLGLFGGRAQPLMSQLIESGHLTLDDIEAARRQLRERQEE